MSEHGVDYDAGRILGSLAVESIHATVEAAEAEPTCMCREGAYLGAQRSGDPIRCERCHKVVCPPETRIIAALLTQIEALSAAVDRVRRRHPRGDEEGGLLAPGLWCPTCGRERRDNGYGACDDRQALIVPGIPARDLPPGSSDA
jgi:hypothetical protein